MADVMTTLRNICNHARGSMRVTGIYARSLLDRCLTKSIRQLHIAASAGFSHNVAPIAFVGSHAFEHRELNYLLDPDVSACRVE